ncbi:hypothetical protein FA13DRAFT_1693931 [Coprinellus micaceus]|uniref:Mucoidy inhibitor A n=1 Tax=Coprinellus micaceus TaxID=71717 RepID=A0A4Y7SQF6_COPMI|nr:hypothetical protein FA13DRAFT_1693931 [Coprinellus micaceus]
MSRSPGTVNNVHLGSQGRISSVSVYSDRAEVIKMYKLAVAAGQNKVVVDGLPYTLDETSVRVEGRGDATIHDVTVSLPTRAPPPTSTSPELLLFSDQREETTTALSRYRKALTRLDRYLEARTEHYNNGGAPHAIPDDVGSLMENYLEASGKYDDKVLELKRELRKIDKAINEEHAASQKFVGSGAPCPYQATIGIYAEEGTEVEIVLKYVVIGAASWKPLYEIRANTESNDSPIEIIYKAAIKQDSGEDWTDVPITLETAKPTFGLSLPALPTWSISVYTPPPPPPPAPPAPSSRYAHLTPQPTGYSSLMQQIQETRDRRAGQLGEEETEREGVVHARTYQRSRAPPPPPARRSVPMQITEASVSSSGLGVNATFKVPGLITIPSDGAAHSVTVAKLKPKGRLSWLAMPQVGNGVHLTASITNSSEYTLLAGPSTVYLDESFVAKSKIPLTGPQGGFTCALGLDPSIRLTIPPPTSSTSTSGILTKTTCTSYAQRISVHNTKNAKVENLRVLARIPVSLDEKINVRLVEPSLPAPPASTPPQVSSGTSTSPPSVKESSEKSSIQAVGVAEGVTAWWYSGNGSEMNGVEDGAGGQEGKIQWNCAIDAKAKVDMTLRWDVGAGKDIAIVGL